MRPYTQPAPYHGQWGEDRWLTEAGLLPEHGVFVDVGAGDGHRGSNTLLLERSGWHGLCIDPEPRHRAPLTRRRCAVEHCAVAARPGQRDFAMHTRKPSRSGLWCHGPDYRTITVTAERLDTLLQRHAITTIDLLSIDTEGSELDVWASFTPRHHTPRIVIVEYDDTIPERHTDRITHALGPGYRLLHRTPANLLLAHTPSVAP